MQLLLVLGIVAAVHGARADSDWVLDTVVWVVGRDAPVPVMDVLPGDRVWAVEDGSEEFSLVETTVVSADVVTDTAGIPFVTIRTGAGVDLTVAAVTGVVVLAGGYFGGGAATGSTTLVVRAGDVAAGSAIVVGDPLGENLTVDRVVSVAALVRSCRVEVVTCSGTVLVSTRWPDAGEDGVGEDADADANVDGEVGAGKGVGVGVGVEEEEHLAGLWTTATTMYTGMAAARYGEVVQAWRDGHWGLPDWNCTSQ
jgi:hypothetical protein